MNWTPWKLSTREDGAGDLYEWLNCIVMCEDHLVYSPVSVLVDSIPEDPDLREKMLQVNHSLVVEDMRRHGCDHDVPPIPSFK